MDILVPIILEMKAKIPEDFSQWSSSKLNHQHNTKTYHDGFLMI